MGCRRSGKGVERTNSEGAEGGMERGDGRTLKRLGRGGKFFFFFTKSFSESNSSNSEHTLRERGDKEGQSL